MNIVTFGIGAVATGAIAGGAAGLSDWHPHQDGLTREELGGTLTSVLVGGAVGGVVGTISEIIVDGSTNAYIRNGALIGAAALAAMSLTYGLTN
jgi:hypothetical protein